MARAALIYQGGFLMPYKQQPPKQRWFVVNMCNRWKQDHISRKNKPTKVFRSLADAYTEAVKMADSHTAGDYAIFECIGRVASVKPPTEEPER